MLTLYFLFIFFAFASIMYWNSISVLPLARKFIFVNTEFKAFVSKIWDVEIEFGNSSAIRQKGESHNGC